jgi:cell shape-determining protein MreC
MRVRQRIHQEIRIYIDALTTQQSNLNGYLIRVATHMVETLDELGLRTMKREQREQAELLAALQDEVRALRREVEQLRAERTTVPIDERSSNGVAHGG